VAGVDGNDLGYYSNGGRGSVVAMVEANGQELFHSPVLHEGLAGVPGGRWNCTARASSKLKLTAVGQHGARAGGVDQADWSRGAGDAGRTDPAVLADLGRAARERLPRPTRRSHSATTDANRGTSEGLACGAAQRGSWMRSGRSMCSTYTDPKTGLVVRAWPWRTRLSVVE